MLSIARRMSITVGKRGQSIMLSSAIGEYTSKKDPKYNVPESIVEKLDRKLHLQQHHPLNIIKKRYFLSDQTKNGFIAN